MLVEIIMEGAMQGHPTELRCVDGIDAPAAIAELVVRHGQRELQLRCLEIVLCKSRQCGNENDQGQNLCRARDR
jgi:hypothetical protein